MTATTRMLRIVSLALALLAAVGSATAQVSAQVGAWLGEPGNAGKVIDVGSKALADGLARVKRDDVAAVAGASTYVVLVTWVGQGAITLTASIAVTLLLRLSAVWFDLHLPTERPKE